MPPPIPFPYPLRIGTDVCRIARIARILRGPHGPRFIQRVLAPDELARPRPAVAAILDAAAAAAVRAAPGDYVAGPRSRPLFKQGNGREWEKREVKEEEDDEDERSLKEKEEAAAAAAGGDGDGDGGGDGWTRVQWQAASFLAGRWVACFFFLLRTAAVCDDECGGRRLTTVSSRPLPRWAAKEAAIKAHPHLRLGFHDIVILTPSEAEEGCAGDQTTPERHANAPMALIRAGDGRRDQMALVSISHDGGYATAVCIGFDPGPTDESGDRQQRPRAEKPKRGFFSWLFSR